MSNSTIKEIRRYLSNPPEYLEEGIKLIRVTLDKLEQAKAGSSEKSQADVLRLLNEIEREYSQLDKQYAELRDINHSLQEKLSSKAYEFANLGESTNPTALTVGISDLVKRNEEAIFDALSAFDKLCPYCGKDHYRVGIRDKIEIDHFVPISRGGQDVPWNLLPVCKECNRKKKDHQAINFLSPLVYRRCQDYLLSVRKRYFDEGIHQYESLSHLKILVNNNLEFLQRNASEPFVRDLVQLISPEKIEDIHRISGLEKERDPKYKSSSHGMLDYLADQISNRKGEFAKGVIGSPFHLLCDRLAELAPSNVKVSQVVLLKILKKLGWVDCGRLASADYKSKKHIYAAPELVDTLSKSELRRMLENR